MVSAICNNGDLRDLKNRHTVFRVPYLEAKILTDVS